MSTGVWTSTDEHGREEWRVEVRRGWSRTSTTGTDYYQVKRWGTLEAEVTTIAELAAKVPLHLLVEQRD